MKKIIFCAALAIASFNASMAANFAPEANVATATADCSDCYKGTLYNLKMNGKSKSDVSNQCFHLTTTDGNGRLTVTVKQIGSMPGTVKLDMVVTVTDGNITVNNTNNVGGLYIDGSKFTSFKLTSFTGTIVNGTLTISNCAVSGQYTGLFPASFSFTGTACDGSDCECE